MGFRDERYLDLAKYFSTWSKDPSRGVSACAIGAHGQVLAQGYNGFPRGVKDDIERYENKDFKYRYVVHVDREIYQHRYNQKNLPDTLCFLHLLDERYQVYLVWSIDFFLVDGNVF